MLKKLLQTGVSLMMVFMIAVLIQGCKGPSENTLYEVAERGVSRKRAQQLINRGEDVNERDPTRGWTPLHAAVAKGRPKMTQFLLDQSANVNARANDGSSPLHIAMAGNHMKVVSILLMHGADKTIRNNLGEAPSNP